MADIQHGFKEFLARYGVRLEDLHIGTQYIPQLDMSITLAQSCDSVSHHLVAGSNVVFELRSVSDPGLLVGMMVWGWSLVSKEEAAQMVSYSQKLSPT